jgi:DNA-binding NtrC family response regulator
MARVMNCLARMSLTIGEHREDHEELPLVRFGELEGRAPATRQLIEQLERIAATRSTVLIEGETGTGKGLIARELHRQSRPDRPLVTIECERDGDVLGDADGGTLICDEVAALSLSAQSRLLRAIETGTMQGTSTRAHRAVDVRIVAVTRENLAQLCERGLFRRDLYFCLRALRVRVPPLRERLADLPLLLEAHGPEVGCPPERFRAPELLAWLRQRRWPGNVRELRNVLARLALLGLDAVLAERDDPPPSTVVAPRRARAFVDARQELMARLEYEYVLRLLSDHHGNLTQAARVAGQTRKWLRCRVRRYGIDVDRLRARRGPREEPDRVAG